MSGERELRAGAALDVGDAFRHAELATADLGEHADALADRLHGGTGETKPQPALAVGLVGRPIRSRVDGDAGGERGLREFWRGSRRRTRAIASRSTCCARAARCKTSRSRINDAALRLRALHRIRDTQCRRTRSQVLFTFQTANLVPAARFLRPGFAFSLHAPHEGVGGAPRVVRVLARHPVGLHSAAGQAPGEAPCVLRGTLASRRSTVAVFGSGAALSLTGIASGSVPASSSHRVVVPGGGVPYLPGRRLPAAAAGRHALLRVQVVSRTRPLTSKAGRIYTSPHAGVNMKSH